MKGNLTCPCEKCSGTLDTRLLSLLSSIEKGMGKELYITSGYRCPSYNAKVGGVSNSAHTKGYAADVSISNSLDRYAFLKVVLASGIKRIGISFDGSFIHIDIDESLPQEVVWGY